jgi:uncharacterized protein YxjI
MRYIMKQKLFSWGDDFTIKDENGADVFLVDGKAFSLGKQLSFQDLQGQELAFIKQRLLSWGPAYEIYKDERLYATVKKELFTLFACTFTVHVEGHGDLEAKGDLSDHEYVFTRNDSPTAEISKQWFAWSDTYGVDIAEGEDTLLILASTVVIDMACHADSRT